MDVSLRRFSQISAETEKGPSRSGAVLLSYVALGFGESRSENLCVWFPARNAGGRRPETERESGLGQKLRRIGNLQQRKPRRLCQPGDPDGLLNRPVRTSRRAETEKWSAQRRAASGRSRWSVPTVGGNNPVIGATEQRRQSAPFSCFEGSREGALILRIGFQIAAAATDISGQTAVRPLGKRIQKLSGRSAAA